MSVSIVDMCLDMASDMVVCHFDIKLSMMLSAAQWVYRKEKARHSPNAYNTQPYTNQIS